MSNPASVSSFLRTGKLGPLELGCSHAVVHTLLGAPEAVGRGTAKTSIERHAGGRLELTFSKAGVLVLIALFPFRGTELERLPLVDPLPPEVQRSPAEFEQWLKREGIAFDVVDPDDESYAVRLHTGVTATFEQGSLYTLQCT